MPQNCFHPSVEGAQHGAKSLADFLDYAKKVRRDGRPAVQLHAPGRQRFQERQGNQRHLRQSKMKLDGVSAHCPFWVHTTAWTGSPTIRPFIPAGCRQEIARTNREMGRRLSAQAAGSLRRTRRENCPDVLGRGFRLGNGHRLSLGILEGRRLRSAQGRPERFVKKTAKLRAAREFARHLSRARNSSRHRRHVRGRFQHARRSCDGDKCLDGERRSVALLGRRRLGNAFPQSRPIASTPAT